MERLPQRFAELAQARKRLEQCTHHAEWQRDTVKHQIRVIVETIRFRQRKGLK